MESAENGFKRHHLIPFSQKIPRAVAASLTSREEKNHPLFEKKKSVSLSNSCTFHICKQWNSSEKENEHTISAKNPSECTICILFSKIFSGRSPDPPPPTTKVAKGYSLTHPHRRIAQRLVFNPLRQWTKFLDPSLTMQCIFLIQFY